MRRSEERTQRSYESHPYRTHAWTSCQPARLQTIARLHGVDAALPDACRVLEIGCGDGGNLIPLAVAHPDSAFFGIDLAPVHVATGRAQIGDLALANVELSAGSFVELDESIGEFDYVIAHGLMSWITPELQELLFDRVAQRLAPNGIAFVSYNTWPGWSMQHAIRTLMRHHTAGVTDVDEALGRSQALLEALVATVPAKEAAYRDYLEVIARVARDPERKYYFVHEYLEDENHPFFVRDFVERAGRHGLAYLADADLVDAEIDNMPVESSTPLERLSTDALGRLQTLDYAVNRKFRQSLLQRAPVHASESPDLARVESMYVLSALRPDAVPVDVASDAVAAFSDRHGRTIEVDLPLVKGALDCFASQDAPMLAFDDLVARSGVDGVSADDRRTLAVILGRLFMAGMVEIQASPPCWATELPERPCASALVRQCAEQGRNTTSLRHRTLELDSPDVREVLQRLDGTRSRDELAADLGHRLGADELDRILLLAVRNGVLCR